MEIGRNVGLKALAVIFSEIAAQKGHWYNLLEPSASDELKKEINPIFPPVSSIMHLDATTMDKVFKKCLLFKEKGTNTIIDWYAWDQFIIEHMLDIEVTKIKINSKTHHLVRLGSFEDSLANKTAIFIWKNRVCPPNLRIYRLSREFAATVGRMGLPSDDDVSDEEGNDGDEVIQSDNDSLNDLDNNNFTDSGDGAVNQMGVYNLNGVSSTAKEVKSRSDGMCCIL